jgi:hypothetical protein
LAQVRLGKRVSFEGQQQRGAEMAKRPTSNGANWSAADMRALKAMAKSGIGATKTAQQLGRTAAAVQQKAMRAGISFRARKKQK